MNTDDRRELARFGFYALLAVTSIGAVLTAFILREATKPDPGADMALMGVPLIGPWVLLAAASLFAYARFARSHLSRVEARLAVAASLLSLVLVVAAFALAFEPGFLDR